jgi:hypothetical protein
MLYKFGTKWRSLNVDTVLRVDEELRSLYRLYQSSDFLYVKSV